jgi:hypothetical protein
MPHPFNPPPTQSCSTIPATAGSTNASLFFWYGCETSGCVLLNFFYLCKTMTSEPNLKPPNDQKWQTAKSGEYDNWWMVQIWFFYNICCFMMEM